MSRHQNSISFCGNISWEGQSNGIAGHNNSDTRTADVMELEQDRGPHSCDSYELGKVSINPQKQINGLVQ